ncbi:MAG: hypothetical protein ABIB43_01075 [archaeon]
MTNPVKIIFKEYNGLLLPTGYKVLTTDMQSIGLRNCPEDSKIQYELNEWMHINEEFIRDDKDRGGLWVAKRISGCKSLKKYMMKHYSLETRVFECLAGENYHDVSSYRYKTDKIMLTEELFFNM